MTKKENTSKYEITYTEKKHNDNALQIECLLLLFLLFISPRDETRHKFKKKHQNMYRFKPVARIF